MELLVNRINLILMMNEGSKKVREGYSFHCKKIVEGFVLLNCAASIIPFKYYSNIFLWFNRSSAIHRPNPIKNNNRKDKFNEFET